MAIQTILVPTDFSPPSQQALEVACSLARPQHARLVIVHVMDLPVAYCENPLVYTFPAEEVGEAERELNRVVPPDASVACEHRLLKGETATAILKAAEEAKADLIVIGTHGHTGAMHVLLGSVAEKVMRHALCPVMAVKAPHSREARADRTPLTESETVGRPR
jgi:universal stress protein A